MTNFPAPESETESFLGIIPDHFLEPRPFSPPRGSVIAWPRGVVAINNAPSHETSWRTFRSCRKSKHTRQLSRIIRESPGYGTDLPLSHTSHTGHQISRIKSSYELFCALVRDLAQFKLKTSIFLIRSTVSGAFLHVFSHSQRLFLASKRWLRNLIVCTSCKTPFNVLSHSYSGLGQFVGVGVRWNSGGGSEKKRVSRF